MSLFWIIAGNVGHAVAAALLVSLAILTSRRAGKTREEHALVVALVLTALWSLRHALAGVLNLAPLPDGVAETVRNGAWLIVLAFHLQRISVGRSFLRRGRPLVILALALLLVTQLGFDLLIGGGGEIKEGLLATFEANWLLRCTFAVGALVLLHSLAERRSHPVAARRDAWIGAALAFMWAYDFNYYFLSWVTGGQAISIGPMRGVVMALLSAILAIGLRMDGTRPMALSRAVMMRVISLGILILYVLVVMLLAAMSSQIAAPLSRVVPFALLFALAVSVLALLPSTSLRSWLRVAITKHLFAHRYDYRSLWLRYAATVAESSENGGRLPARVTRAIAEAIDAPAALLFLRDEAGQLARVEQWNWPDVIDPVDRLDAKLAERIGQSGWIVDIEADWADYGALLPAWMRHSSHVWAIAPLIHRGQLLGVILLAAPPGARRLDWEDLDVLRVVCDEAAARISEARSRVALAEAQRFDEFNRRFAFILHDLKNLVSQMSLLASNAQRHADNPAFREDMVLTLQETATRMTELLQRLGRPGSMAGGERGGVALGAMVRTLAPRWAAGFGRVEVEGEVVRLVRADADSLTRALDHIVRNAIEASPSDSPVTIRLANDEHEASLHIIDRGRGMSADFIRDQLFHPFSSTKSNGFGLGAHEARLLIWDMGGSLDVESVEGEFTHFTIKLPFADRLPGVRHGPSEEPTRKTG